MSATLLSLLIALQTPQMPARDDAREVAPVLLAEAHASVHPPASRALDALRADLDTAKAASDRNDVAVAIPLYDRALADPGFDALPPKERADAFANAAWIDYVDGRHERALQRALAADALDRDNLDNVYHIMLIHLAAAHPAQAADTMRSIFERWPDRIADLPPQRFYDVADALDDQPERKLAYLQMLWDKGWDDPENNPWSMWLALVDLRLARGEIEQAKRALERVDGARAMVRLRSDRRYDAIVDRDSPRFDAVASARRAVEALEAKAKVRPRDLAVRSQITYALLDAGQLDRVIDLADELLDEQHKPRLKATKFDDPDQRVWILNNRALARYRLGQIDQALADMRKARDIGGDVGPTLNLGALECALGRADDALAAVARVPESRMSDYGKAVHALQRLCAGILKHDAALQSQAMTFLKAHREEIPDTYFEALVMQARLDEAAKLLIARLDDPAQRGQVLIDAQDVLRAPEFEGNRRWRENRRALYDRPDVRAAIERAGRVERYDVYIGHDYD